MVPLDATELELATVELSELELFALELELAAELGVSLDGEDEPPPQDVKTPRAQSVTR
jgi:hypothetical protein